MDLIGKKYEGIIDCFKKSFKHEGLAALWRGNLTNLYRNIPTIALTLAFSDSIREKVCPYDIRTETLKYSFATFLAGGLGGNLSLIFVYPLDISRTRLSVDIGRSQKQRKFKGIRDCMLKIYKS